MLFIGFDYFSYLNIYETTSLWSFKDIFQFRFLLFCGRSSAYYKCGSYVKGSIIGNSVAHSSHNVQRVFLIGVKKEAYMVIYYVALFVLAAFGILAEQKQKSLLSAILPASGFLAFHLWFLPV